MKQVSPVKIWRQQKEIAQFLSKEGKIISWTIVRVVPQGYEAEAPYPVVLVKLEDGQRLTAQLADWQGQDLSFGKKVKVVFRRVRKPDPEGVIPYGLKVKLK